MKLKMKQVITNSVCRILVLVAAILISYTEADFPCYCNYNVEASVYSSPDSTSSVLGYMYEFDCKADGSAHGAHKGFYPIQFQGQLGYITINDQLQSQTCPGSPSTTDFISTTTHKPHGHSTTSADTASSMLSSIMTMFSTVTTAATTSLTPISTTHAPTTQSTAVTMPTSTATTAFTTTKHPPSTTSSTTQPMTSTTTQQITSTISQPTTTATTQQITSTTSQPTTTGTTQQITSTTTQPTTRATTQQITSTTSQPTTTATTQQITSTTSQPSAPTSQSTTATTTTPTVTWPGLTLTSTEYTTTPYLYWSMAANVSGTPLQFIGIGYNLMTGNPLAAHDPGLLLDKRILQLTRTSSNVREASIALAQRCPSVVTQTLVHGSKSLQKEMNTLVQPSSTHPNSLTDLAFVSNPEFHIQRANLENGVIVYQDSLTTCKIGSAHYHGNSTAPFGNFSVSREFAKAVCKLSSANTTTIQKFLDVWGTSVVLSVDLGTKSLSRKTESIQQMFQTIQTTDPSLLVLSGPFKDYASSLTINIHNYSTSPAAQQSSTQKLVMTAGGTTPVPVGMSIVPITDVISPIYFASVLENLVAESICPDSLYDGELDRIAANVKSALDKYNAHKQYETNFNPVLTDHSIKMPVTWPRGTYGLMKTASGCPASHVTWSEGWRYQDTEDISSGSSHTSGISHLLAGSFHSNNIQTEFCIKSQSQVSEYDGDWPRGAYCLLKKGNCPAGFQNGSIYWDDETTLNKNKAGGTLPDGEFGHNTKIYYCCRNDGPTSAQVILPIDRPFVLLRYGLTCQNVHSMQLQELFVHWDDDDSTNHDSSNGMHPYDDGGSHNHRLHFCYYQKNSPGTSIVG